MHFGGDFVDTGSLLFIQVFREPPADEAAFGNAQEARSQRSIVAPGASQQAHHISGHFVPHWQHVVGHRATAHDVRAFVVQSDLVRDVQPLISRVRRVLCGNVAVRSFGDDYDLAAERTRLLRQAHELAVPIAAARCQICGVRSYHFAPVGQAPVCDGAHRACDGRRSGLVADDLQERLEIATALQEQHLDRACRRVDFAQLVLRASLEVIEARSLGRDAMSGRSAMGILRPFGRRHVKLRKPLGQRFQRIRSFERLFARHAFSLSLDSESMRWQELSVLLSPMNL